MYQISLHRLTIVEDVRHGENGYFDTLHNVVVVAVVLERTALSLN